ncbi:MAG: MaoC family dehydratase [bacterium]
MAGKTVDQLSVGDAASSSRTVTEGDVYTFGGIIGDLNPLHTDEVTASKSVFGKRVAHGMLTASLLSGVMAHQLPGDGTIFLGLEVKFLKPVYFGDTITARVEIADIVKRKVTMTCQCTNQDGEAVLEGAATVLAPK